jgi:hypothetical protein
MDGTSLKAVMVIVLVVFDKFADIGIAPARNGYWIQSPRSKTQVRIHCFIYWLRADIITLRFPPKNAKLSIDPTGLSLPIATFPTATIAQSEIWEEGTRKMLQKPRFKKKDLDRRRSQVNTSLFLAVR